MNPRPRLSCQDSPEASSTTVSCATQNIHADGALFARMHVKSVFKSCDCLLCNCSTEIGQDGGKFVCGRDDVAHMKMCLISVYCHRSNVT